MQLWVTKVLLANNFDKWNFYWVVFDVNSCCASWAKKYTVVDADIWWIWPPTIEAELVVLLFEKLWHYFLLQSLHLSTEICWVSCISRSDLKRKGFLHLYDFLCSRIEFWVDGICCEDWTISDFSFLIVNPCGCVFLQIWKKNFLVIS